MASTWGSPPAWRLWTCALIRAQDASVADSFSTSARLSANRPDRCRRSSRTRRARSRSMTMDVMPCAENCVPLRVLNPAAVSARRICVGCFPSEVIRRTTLKISASSPMVPNLGFPILESPPSAFPVQTFRVHVQFHSSLTHVPTVSQTPVRSANPKIIYQII